MGDETRVTGDIGGQPKQTYWTPDGRPIRAMPDMHEWAKKDNKGVVIENGVRDANLDKGWLLSKPTELKLYCPHCDLWHNEKSEIIKCERSRSKLIAKHTKQAKKDLSGNGRLNKLENDMDEIKNLLTKLLEAK